MTGSESSASHGCTNEVITPKIAADDHQRARSGRCRSAPVRVIPSNSQAAPPERKALTSDPDHETHGVSVVAGRSAQTVASPRRPSIDRSAPPRWRSSSCRRVVDPPVLHQVEQVAVGVHLVARRCAGCGRPRRARAGSRRSAPRPVATSRADSGQPDERAVDREVGGVELGVGAVALPRQLGVAGQRPRTSSRACSPASSPAPYTGHLEHRAGPAHVAHRVRVEVGAPGCPCWAPGPRGPRRPGSRAPRARSSGRRRATRPARPRAAASRRWSSPSKSARRSSSARGRRWRPCSRLERAEGGVDTPRLSDRTCIAAQAPSRTLGLSDNQTIGIDPTTGQMPRRRTWATTLHVGQRGT